MNEKRYFKRKKLSRIKALFILVLIIGCIFFGIDLSVKKENFEETKVFQSGDNNYQFFRIPSVIKAPNDVILAFCEGRKEGLSDFGDIDIVQKRSIDNGKSWSPLQLIIDNGENQAGNPTPVVDNLDPKYPDGRIFLHYNTRSHSEKDIVNGNGIVEVWYVTSTDNGVTWSIPVNITTQVNRPNEPLFNPEYNFTEDWRWFANGPGNAIQLKTGRLLIPGNHSTGNFEDFNNHSHVYFSDNHGLDWQLGGILGKNTNESTIVELTNGEIMINMRRIRDNSRKRGVAISRDGGLSFGSVYSDKELIEPQVHASIIRFTNKVFHERNRLLFSNPKSSKERENMTVRISYDEGNTWSDGKTIYSGHSAYSDLVILNDFTIGLLYERDKYSEIAFAHFNLKWLSEGQDDF